MKKQFAEVLGTFGLVFCGTGAMVSDPVAGGGIVRAGADAGSFLRSAACAMKSDGCMKPLPPVGTVRRRQGVETKH